MDSCPSPPAAAARLRVGGRYQLLHRLAAGTVSDVWAARDPVLGRAVAVKIFHRCSGSSDPRALAEARAAARSRSRNVVAILDGGRDRGRTYLVMELMAGATLRGAIDDGCLSLPELRRLARDVLTGLHAVHEMGLAHRNIEPTNILQGRDGNWKIADFGAAAALAPIYGISELESEVVGTPGYLAPERLAGRPASIASDLFAAAVVLREAATGTPPELCRCSAAPAVRSAPSRTALVPSPAQLAGAAFLRALSPALDVDPTRRPPSAQAFAEAIDGAVCAALARVAARPAAHRPPPPAARTGVRSGVLERRGLGLGRLRLAVVGHHQRVD